MSKHRAVALVVAALVTSFSSLGVASDPPANEFEILTGFSAKETCSCVFVVGQTDAYCSAFGEQAGYVVKIAIDRTAKSVTSSFNGTSRTATFTAAAGCVLTSL